MVGCWEVLSHVDGASRFKSYYGTMDTWPVRSIWTLVVPYGGRKYAYRKTCLAPNKAGTWVSVGLPTIGPTTRSPSGLVPCSGTTNNG